MTVLRTQSFALALFLASSCGLATQAPVASQPAPGPLAISLAEPAAVGLPVWLNVTAPGGPFSYPFDVHPAWFKCLEIEARRDGVPLPRTASLDSQAFDGLAVSGPPCGSLAIPGPSRRPGQIPLHLQYRFDQPGLYEVRLTMRKDWSGDGTPAYQSDWVTVELQPGNPQDRARWLADVSAEPPAGTAELLTGLLPSLLGLPGDTSLQLLLPYLYHPESLVRRYAMYGLTYWPAEQAAADVMRLVRTRGPSDAAVQFLVRGAKSAITSYDALAEVVIPHLRSDSPILLQGFVAAVRAMTVMDDSKIGKSARARLTDAAIAAASHIARAAAPQTASDYASALGAMTDPRARAVLWRLIGQNVAPAQAAVALTWHPIEADLPRLAALP